MFPLMHLPQVNTGQKILYVVLNIILLLSVMELNCLSHEHTEYKWVTYDEAVKLLKWDSTKPPCGN